MSNSEMGSYTCSITHFSVSQCQWLEWDLISGKSMACHSLEVVNLGLVPVTAHKVSTPVPILIQHIASFKTKGILGFSPEHEEQSGTSQKINKIW